MPFGTEATLHLMPGIKLYACAVHGTSGRKAEWAAHRLAQAEGNKAENLEPADSSCGKMTEATEEGRAAKPQLQLVPCLGYPANSCYVPEA